MDDNDFVNLQQLRDRGNYINAVRNSYVGLEIGWEYFPQRKKPQLVIREPGKSTSLGSFRDEESAHLFFNALGEMMKISMR